MKIKIRFPEKWRFFDKYRVFQLLFMHNSRLISRELSLLHRSESVKGGLKKCYSKEALSLLILTLKCEKKLVEHTVSND